MNQTTAIRMLTINEAAARVPGLSKWRIREMCISGELPHLKAGKKYLINEQVLIGYLTKGMKEFTAAE
jgi:excisionase family DNA binding protein